MARLIVPPSPTQERVRAFKEAQETSANITKSFKSLQPKVRLQVLESVGLASEYYTCQCCNRVLPKTEFYVSTAPGCASGVASICKECAEDIACPVVDGVRKQPNKETVDNALFALNKPMLDSVWDASLLEAANTATGKTKNNVWTSYIKNIQMKNYYTLTYKQSDGYTGGIYTLEDLTTEATPKDQEVLEQFEKNKNDTLRLIGFLPFEKEKITDQPFLYARLIGFLDASEEGNDDMMRVSSVISIVRGFLQIDQCDDMIANLVQDPLSAAKNVATVRSLQDMKKNITQNIVKLAEASCISLKHSKNSIKGENTWTGKTKKIKDMNLRDYEVNGFDMNTCRGMQQVQEISDASIMKQLHLDESDWSDMVAEMRQTIVDLRKERDSYKEINRIILRENIDLKDTLYDNGLDVSSDVVDLKELYSPFADQESEVVLDFSEEGKEEPEEDYSAYIEEGSEDEEVENDDAV